MVLKDVRDRFFYMSGYFEDVCKNPQKYSKDELTRYFHVLDKIFASPDEPLDTNDGAF